MKLHTRNMIPSEILIDDISLQFNTIEECIELKNRLIAFIKSKRRDIRDKGIEPELTFNIKNK
tara:strand:+ start:248 stop:436 length:189 start_codon:yes stop_codon:yes gene_type:complete